MNQPKTAITPVKPKSLQKPSSRKGTHVVPSRAMLRFLSATDELGPNAPISQIAKLAKVSRDLWYEWMSWPEFVDWWDKQWQTQFKLHRWKLKAIGLKKAEEDHSWWSDMMKVMGEMPPDAPTPAGPQNAFQFNLGADALRRITED